MSEEKTLTVSILGRSYSLLTDEDPQIIEDAAQMVESLLQRMGGTTLAPAEMAKKATFVALKVAVDLLKERSQLETMCNKTATLNDILEDSLQTM